MKEAVKKSFLLGLGAASITKKEAEKIIGNLVRRDSISIKHGREMLKKIKKHAEGESRRMRQLMEREAKKFTSEVKIVSKDKMEKIKKGFKMLDRELTSEGKKTLNRLMKEFSK